MKGLVSHFELLWKIFLDRMSMESAVHVPDLEHGTKNKHGEGRKRLSKRRRGRQDGHSNPTGKRYTTGF